MAAGFCSSLKAVLLAILLTATLQGCAESHMAKIKDADARIQPKSNEATIVFFRTTKFIGAALVSPIFDITDGELKFVGSLTSGKKLAYTRRADKTARFMV
ncbi:MAG: hypothetical protein OXT06_24540, partial [Rhodospirillaceae bacterium]|nr:hypothetical protein [Rhodospirillaceae bacterium]